jgi:hypothetical protein
MANVSLVFLLGQTIANPTGLLKRMDNGLAASGHCVKSTSIVTQDK